MQRLVEIEALSDLLRKKGVHGAVEGSPGEKIDAGAPKLSGARPAQDETQPLFLQKPMHLVQQLRQALDFVHHHPCRRFQGPDLTCKQ